MAIGVMPALEMAQESEKVISWRKQEGEIVAQGEPLLEVEANKAVTEIESPGERILTGCVRKKTSAAAPLAAVSVQVSNTASRSSRHLRLLESALAPGQAAEFLRGVAEAIGNPVQCFD